MKTLSFKAVFWQTKWLENAVLQVDDRGIIQSCSQDKNQQGVDYLIPGFQNCHSHAFQYGMAGTSEYSKGIGINDSFWSWRQSMYQLVSRLSPDQLENIATMVYAQMIANGYTSVCEFHYLHHKADGSQYERATELSLRMEQAASRSGIRLTLIPVFYNKGGFQRDISPQQRRFYFAKLSDYRTFIDELKVQLKSDTILGTGIHSLRAASLEDSLDVLTDTSSQGPKHIHIAEQLAEVEEFKKIHGKRPVEWICQKPYKTGINLVHATHIDQQEIQSLTQSPHSVVLCPTTEANLGDGFFPSTPYFHQDGRWSIGSDSHIKLSPFQELELIDYSQRLSSLIRNPFTRENYENSGDYLFLGSKTGSELASGRSPYLDIGLPLDGIIIDENYPSLICKPLEHILATMIYTYDSRMIKSVLIAGKNCYTEGKHRDNLEISKAYRNAMAQVFHD